MPAARYLHPIGKSTEPTSGISGEGTQPRRGFVGQPLDQFGRVDVSCQRRRLAAKQDRPVSSQIG